MILQRVESELTVSLLTGKFVGNHALRRGHAVSDEQEYVLGALSAKAQGGKQDYEN